MNLIFCTNIRKFSYNFVVTFLLIIARHVLSTQNGKFVISLQYLEKERNELDFLHANKYQTIQQFDAINLGGHGYASPNYSK